MGNAQQFCCQEPSRNNQQSTITLSKQFNYSLADHLPTLNQFIRKRLQILSSQTLPYQKLPNVIPRGPMQQKDKHFIYQGQWLEDIPHGFGTIYFKTGQYFQGQFRQGCIQGIGRYIFHNGDYYQGFILNNSAQGQGKYQSSFFKFEGCWQNSKPYQGKYKFNNGIIIEISNEHKGTITWPDNKKYQGALKDFNPHGKGVLTFQNGNKYQGQWYEGMMHGKGYFTWNDGSSYRGQYCNGVKHGEGKFVYKNKRKVYNGSWKDGKRHGYGKVLQDNKIIQKGNYQEGRFVNKQNVQQVKKEEDVKKQEQN